MTELHQFRQTNKVWTLRLLVIIFAVIISFLFFSHKYDYVVFLTVISTFIFIPTITEFIIYDNSAEFRIYYLGAMLKNTHIIKKENNPTVKLLETKDDVIPETYIINNFLLDFFVTLFLPRIALSSKSYYITYYKNDKKRQIRTKMTDAEAYALLYAFEKR